MLICKFTEYQLAAKYEKENTGVLITSRTPMEFAMIVLRNALATVNQAGLEGKEITEFTIVRKYEPSKHFDDQEIEIHGKVKHRLKQS